MEIIEIKNLYDFEDFLTGLNGDWVFRGQSNSSWPIESSLYRFFEEAEDFVGKDNRNWRIAAEAGCLEEFKKDGALYLDKLPNDNNLLEWLSIMQHYGSPTRLLDVTCSPYVALFFAVETNQNDAAVYAIKPSHFSALDETPYLDESEYETFIRDGLENNYRVALYPPTFSNERLVIQQGMFLLCNTLKQSMSSILENYAAANGGLYKVIIPGHLKMEANRKLIDLNITSATLYPSLEGYSKSLKNLLIHFLSGASKDAKEMPNKWFQRTSLKLRR